MEHLDFCALQAVRPDRFVPVALSAVYNVLADPAYHIRHRPIPDSLVLVITVSGEGTAELNGRSFRLRAGSAALLDPSLAPFHYFCSGESWQFWWFEFRCVDPDLLKIPPDRVTEAGQELLPLCEKILGYLKLGESRTASLLLASLLGMLQMPLARAGSTGLFEEADRYIRQNLSTVTVRSAAAHLQVSERTLLNIFQSLLHQSVLSYIRRVKMETAQILLYAQDISIKELAERLGYSDPFIFSKAFRQYCGKPPSQYRRESRLFQKPQQGTSESV